ncbi:hypothetical protein GCM10011514_01400 [Emticicia aquatilis]|uniref:Uncharacterized protein n=2 Tax=Emticicia aquatilis TaxID=1537369 RepID=A0A916YDE3_9BACT|nr:hypothetical protein GCM10011514_01400 [Emticicia aquatilis]
MGLLFACQRQENSSNNDLSIATQNYAVLAEKTISYQADFDLDAWSKMLADDVQFELPDDTTQPSLVGRAAAIAAWQKWRDVNKIQSLKFSRFTQIPISSQKAMKFSDLSGVYVFSLFSGTVRYTDGRTADLKMNYCFHFNEAKMIDRYYVFHDKINFTKN